ncbi:MAG: carbohydrate binding domain-containing protein [Planctomycetota bacterium]|nr:carbohydrate binding domain-containing protein [Planctomycetota bacterium]
MLSKLPVWVLLAALATATTVQSADKNLDEDFENGLGRFTVESWRGTEAEQLTDAVTHGGKKAVQLTGGAGAGDVTVLWMKNPAFRLMPGERYTVSLWVKTENVAGVELKVVVPDGVEITGLKSEKLTGTSDWRKLEQSFTVARKVQPKSIGLWMTGPGKLWADDFELKGKTGLEWQKRIEIDPTGVTTEKEFKSLLATNGLKENGFVNWFTGRWPYISFIGGMAMCNRSEDLEFFYEKPFKWWTEVLDYVMEDGGTTYGIRARVRRYKEKEPAPLRSFLLTIRTDTLLERYHPSAIYANGRKVWDSKKHPLQKGKLLVPFSLEAGADPIIDLVIDKQYTPDTKGLAFRMFSVTYLGEPGVKVDLKDTSDEVEGSPADKLEKFAFGVFPSGYDAWTENGPTFAEIRKNWKPNFRPEYPVDKVYLSPVIGSLGSEGKYHDFMVTYGGCNLLGRPDPTLAKKNASYLLGALADIKDPATGKAILALDPKFDVVWFTGEGDNGQGNIKAVADAKQAVGAPEKCVSVHEPFPPALQRAHEFENGTDLLVLKNEEDPQFNILVAMCRGAGHSFNKPFGFYWEQTHYPYPSLDEKLHACLLYFLSGGSWIGAEAENAPCFEKEIVADWVLPYVQALRFAMVHPARGKQVVPVGILWGKGDKWWVPYNPFGQMDTFVRHIEYEHATKTLKCEPAFTHPFPWSPPDRARWNFQTTGHLGWFIDAIPEIQGYDMMDVFFPRFGDACTAHITRLLTGTPHGPVDFLYLDKTSVETLKACGMLAILGHASLNKEAEDKLTQCLEGGIPVFVGAQHFSASHRALGLILQASQPATGAVTGSGAFEGKMNGSYDGKVWAFKGDGWETVARVGDRPIIVCKTIGKARAFVYLGELVKDGGAAIRAVLSWMGEQAAPLKFIPEDDYMEYVAYHKGAGAWVALFNHGNIVIGCDRLKEARAVPPEPLCTKPKGPYRGEIQFRLERLGLDPKADFALYEVEGIDGKAFDEVLSGNKTFAVREIPSGLKDGVIKATVEINKRAQYTIAPKGQGQAVFFGLP